MPSLLVSSVMRFWGYLGFCPVCRRQAFLAALASWVITTVAFSMYGTNAFVLMLGGLSVFPTSLWLLHLFAFAKKTIDHEGSAEPNLDRRAVMPLFLKLLAAAAFASALPSAANATQCGGTKDCSTKTCQGATAKCVSGTRGCFCQ